MPSMTTVNICGFLVRFGCSNTDMGPMRKVGIVGIGQVPVAEHWDRSLRDLSTDAVISALHDAAVSYTHLTLPTQRIV